MTPDGRATIRFCPRCGSERLENRVPRRDDRERQVCATCGYVHYVGPALAAGVVVHEGGRICLVRRAHDPGRGKWTFPGGFVDLDESPAEAGLRETAEETGCLAEIDGLLGVYPSLGPGGRRVVIVVYAGRLTGRDEGRRCEEVEEVRWFARDELPEDEFAFPSTAQALRAYFG